MTLAEQLPNLRRGRQAHLDSLEEFDRGWATLLAQIDQRVKRLDTIDALIVEQYMHGNKDVAELEDEAARLRAELQPLLEARTKEGQLRQRVVTQLAEKRFDEVAADRRKLEGQVRTALTDLRQKADDFAKADAKLRAIGEKDAELANEQIGCNDRGHLNRHIEATFRGIGLGNVDFLIQRIEEDLIAIARRAEGS